MLLDRENPRGSRLTLMRVPDRITRNASPWRVAPHFQAERFERLPMSKRKLATAACGPRPRTSSRISSPFGVSRKGAPMSRVARQVGVAVVLGHD